MNICWLQRTFVSLVPGSLCGFRGEIFKMIDRPRRLVKAPKRFSCDFSTVSRIKDATNVKKDRKMCDIEMVEVDRKESNIANTYKRIVFKNFTFMKKQQVWYQKKWNSFKILYICSCIFNLRMRFQFIAARPELDGGNSLMRDSLNVNNA